MKKLIFMLGLVFAMRGCSRQHAAKPLSATSSATKPVSGPFSTQELQQFTALDPIDTHTHAYQSNPIFFAMLKKLNLHILDIVIVIDKDPARKKQSQGGWAIAQNLSHISKAAWAVVHGSEGHASLCTTFDPYQFNQPGFDATAIRQIDRQFAQGAVAIKIWKNIGMELKDAKGNYILPDNPIFEPIYKDIDAHHITMIAHVADPSSAWEPLDPASPDYLYYKEEQPRWYMYGKPHPPSKEQILKARDHVLEENPNLRVVGAHLGSMEANFPQLARHLDRYPNFAVDLAARMPYLMLQPRADIIAFITKYQDRLIYGTDNLFFPEDDAQATAQDWENNYASDWRFLATSDTLEYQGKKVEGLALPPSILRKMYHDNAVRWFPGILGSSH